MAFRIANRAFACVRREQHARAFASRSCQGTEQPPCPPCPPQPPPPCRATPPTTLRATLRVCCPPPRGHPPPCPPPPCMPALTCAAAKPEKQNLCTKSERCGSDRDRVAVRLALAERERRLDYEREVAARKPASGREPPPAPYTLGAERECAVATDGRSYAMKCERQPPAPCGPDRTPPPPRCVELMRDTECKIRDNVYVDPCAHVPRTVIDIDRSGDCPAPRPPVPPTSACLASSSTDQSPPAKNLTSRIMERLSLSRNSGASCPKSSTEPKCETTGARRAGDTGWCRTQPKPPSVPPCCREPTTMEKIKRRGPGHCTQKKGGAYGKRTFHSSACSRQAAPAACGDRKKGPDDSVTTPKGSANAESLKKVLKERESLQEAGRGRIVIDMGDVRKAAQNTTSGRLDIPVPLGAQNVRVRVSLEGAETSCNGNHQPEKTTVNFSATDCAAAKADKSESWLSLKSLHKKLAGCRKNDSVKLVKDKKRDGGSAPASCPRPQPPKSKPSPPQNPCAKPVSQPRGEPCPPLKPPPCAAPPPTPAAPPKPSSTPSAPSAPPRRTCPTHGRPTVKKPTRFSTATDSDFLAAETLFIKW